MNTSPELLANYLGGRWQSGTGNGTTLHDPITGDALVRVDATGVDLAEAFEYARETGGQALRAMTYVQRAAMLDAIVKVLQSHRGEYEAISVANSGTVKADTAVDVDGGIYTLGVYAKLGQGLGEVRHLVDGDAARMGKDPLFQSQHVQVPTRGVALFINAFNFPSWGLWEKAAPALLSGVPVIVKPATATAWLTQRMVKDVIDAGVVPAGALSVVCGRSEGLLEQLKPFDVVSFTGSADTAAVIRSHPSVIRHSVRLNVEADSVNSALLAPGEANAAALDLLVREVVREMTVKSGQKCTAIRRIFVPEALYDTAAQAISAKLAGITVGDPRRDNVRMGALVSRAQFDTVRQGIEQLAAHADVIHDGRGISLEVDSAEAACCVGPTLLGARDPDTNAAVHDIEVFGPVATLMPYRDEAHALGLIRKGQGSLVASVYGTDPADLGRIATALADSHGRVHVITPDVAKLHTGHGNVMPQSLHGGPGRAGGGEELGGLRALNFYHRRSAIQASTDVLSQLG